jgi:hypothetical protein
MTTRNVRQLLSEFCYFRQVFKERRLRTEIGVKYFNCHVCTPVNILRIIIIIVKTANFLQLAIQLFCEDADENT